MPRRVQVGRSLPLPSKDGDSQLREGEAPADPKQAMATDQREGEAPADPKQAMATVQREGEAPADPNHRGYAALRPLWRSFNSSS